MRRHGLIAERVAFASKVDASQCPDVQNFIQEKVNYEAFLEWAQKDEVREVRPDTNEYPKRSPFISFTAFLP